MRFQSTVVILAFLTGSAAGAVRLHPRVYFGLGFGGPLTSVAPAVPHEDTWDANYWTLNGSSVPKIILRGQLRVQLLHAGAWSLGYTFWGHSIRYPIDYPEVWLKEDRTYPHSHHASAHAAVVQWNPVRSKRARITPLAWAGAGPCYGSSSKVLYRWIDADSLAWIGFIQPDRSFQGAAFLGGAGIVLFRYATVCVLYTHLDPKGLPANDFLELNLGANF
jgi:hypothetical protein